MIPATLDGWSLAKIHEVVALGVTENDRFDLKADLQSAEHQRKTVAAFANADGGFLVFGVTDDRRVVGVSNVELVRDFGSRVRDGFIPSAEFHFAHHPHVLPDARLVYVAQVSRGSRGPHAVYVNGAWTFVKRTAAGTNDPMTYEEIRGAFAEAGRRRNELAWLLGEVERIERLADGMSVRVSNDFPMTETLLMRLDPVQLKTLMVPLFGDLVARPTLVALLQTLVEGCAKMDETLTPLAIMAISPRDRSYSGSSFDVGKFVLTQADRITATARRAITELKELLA